MKRLYIGSMKRFSGKNLFTLGLALDLKERGYQIGYIKPAGKSPVIHEGVTVDADALFFAETLHLKEKITTLSPFVSTFDAIHLFLSGKMKEPGEEIFNTINSIKDKDILFIAGTTDIFEGSIFGINGISIVKKTKSKALVIESWKNEETINDILGAQEIFADELLGVIINEVREELFDFMKTKVVPFLKGVGIDVFGIVPTEPFLKAAAISTLNEVLGGTVLCAEDRLDQMVENYSIGAMDVNHALKFFKMTPDKAVITGADRSDIQLAALETSTKCIILTGGMVPNDVIIGKASLKGIPVISVNEDTFKTVDKIESILGKQKIRGQEKIQKVKELIKQHVDSQEILKKLGVRML